MFNGNSSNRVDARQSHFSNVGRDQHIHQTIVNIPTTASQESVLHVSQQPPSYYNVLISQHHHFVCDLAANLLAEIMRLLRCLREFADDYGDLQDLLFKPLHQTLFLTGIGIRAFEDTPLGPNLTASINPEVEKCCVLFKDIFDSIGRYQVLRETSIRNLWPRVLWSGSKVHELAWKLNAHRSSLGQFVVALNSYISFCIIRRHSLNSTLRWNV